ncbi:Kelch-like protein 8 [Histomonas meleagridis]|uniref:Kelch-like protein 8 n=1 Tax=Histomonas meleagridis TaxID=135588 RepID=UPI00355A4CC9|nr:Kelch-like protein 8 [Histomonas meleagridis]KAH0796566.1 Kelch-like protein 8 [Histomonas meleagridis]
MDADLMWGYVEQNLYTDLTLEISGNQYKCHKVVLASTKGYFEDIFTSNFSEANSDYVIIRIPDEGEVFKYILKYIYTKDTSFIQPKNMIFILVLAKYFRLNELMQAVENKLTKNLADDAILEIVESITKCMFQIVPQNLFDSIASKFYLFSSNDNIMNLSKNNVLQIIQNPNLKVASEVQLASWIVTYGKSYDLDESFYKQATNYIQWQMLSPQELENFDHSLLITNGFHDSICNGYEASKRRAPGFAKIQIALNSVMQQKTFKLFNRYEPPLVTFFKDVPDFFVTPGRYKCQTKGMLSNQVPVEGRITFLRDYLGCFTEVELVTSYFNVNNVSIELVSHDGIKTPYVIRPTHSKGNTRFHATFETKTGIRTVILKFPKVKVQPTMVSCKVSGFWFHLNKDE